MVHPLRWLWRTTGSAYLRIVVLALLAVAFGVTLAGMGLLLLYQDMSARNFWTLVGFAEALAAVEVLVSAVRVRSLLRPTRPWLAGSHREEDAARAWVALVDLPLRLGAHRAPLRLAISVVPIAVLITHWLDLGWYSAPILAMGGCVVVAYGVLLRFFGLEIVLRPVLEDMAADLPADTVSHPPAHRPRALPLRWRMLLALPAINVITGVVVAALSTTGRQSLADLGFDVIAAVGVAFSLSLGLSLLLSRSLLIGLGRLRAATERVADGDLFVRVPVTSDDEIGRLSGAFNAMVAGLQERAALHGAFGSYVDPALADRVVSEGELLGGEELEVTVLFLDVRNFTAYAEQQTAQAVVAKLNEFFDIVVPVLAEHGGHANKFLGDGLLGVFGAPDRHPDHADRAVAAALEINRRVNERYEGRVRIGLGLHSGPAVVGTIGGGGRLEYTVIGDTVNTASRVEALTRETGDDMLVTDSTRALLRTSPCDFLPRGTMTLKGRSATVIVHAAADTAPTVYVPVRGQPAT